VGKRGLLCVTRPAGESQSPEASKKRKGSPFQYEEMRESRVGLVNLGNTCYLNATLQCLAHIPFVAQLLLNSEPNEQGTSKERHVSSCWSHVRLSRPRTL